MVAHALGGAVDYNPGKRFILKAETICLEQPIFSSIVPIGDSGNPSAVQIIVSHGDCVETLPERAVRLGSSATCQNELFAVHPPPSATAGRKANILCCQSHPEFDLEYCIHERIWPAVVDQNKRLSDEQVVEARESFAKYTGADAATLLQMISLFLRQ